MSSVMDYDAVNIGKNFMMNAVTAIEFMNERYDPFGFKLKGWSDQMQLGLESYDTVLGELYEKWKHTDLTIDAVKGIGGMFSLDNGTGERFLTKSEICLVEDDKTK